MNANWNRDMEERLADLERHAARSRRAILFATALVGIALTVGFTGPFAPPDPEAIKLTTPNLAGTATTRVKISGNESPAKIGFVGSNVGIGTASEFGSGVGVLGIANASTVPSSNPSGGGVAYSQSGRFKWRRPDGGIDTLGSDWELVSEANAGSDTSSLSVSVDGNADYDYLIRIRVIAKGIPADTTRNYAVRFNNDSGNNYTYTLLANNDSSQLVLGTNTLSFIALGALTANDQTLFVTGFIQPKLLNGAREANFQSNVKQTIVRHTAARWANNAANLTSVDLIVTEGGNHIGQNSKVAVFRRIR